MLQNQLVSRRVHRAYSVASVAVVLIALSVPAQAEDKLEILPAEFTLQSPALGQSLLVERTSGERYVGQVTDGVTFESSDAKIVAIEDGVARPVGNGQATLTAKVGNQSATAKVTVAGVDAPYVWSFRNHVESVLSKSGCNSGACHGAAAGKNGFKLSLRGYDPDGDFMVLTRQQRGRRIVPSDPGRSLMLTKPSGAVPHKGGLRFQTNSLEYRVLSEWIAAGAPQPQAADARIDKLEIVPTGVVLKSPSAQQLLVRARFTDGHWEDVTQWTKFTSANESVAQVDDQGKVDVVGHGEGAITAWYLSRVAKASVSVPFETAVPAEVFAQAPRRNFIDERVLTKLQNLNIPPSPQAADGEFIRRAFLDTIGILPTADETRAFLADPSPDKRDKLIEALLARPEFVDYWSYKWSDLLLVNSERLPSQAMWAYYSWIRNRVEANTPWDQFARELLTAKGSTLENGAANFYALHRDPLDLSETTSVALLGMSINCARCHNHPLEKWTNNQYYAMANLFARVRTKVAPGDGNAIIFSDTAGELIQPLTGKPQPPTPLDGEVLPLDATGDRRVHLAKWLTSRDNPYFSRAIANRVWANFFGVGLVEMVDDMRLTNPASNEELLAAAAGHLADNKFDLKALMRAILQSAAYQRTSHPLKENAADQRFYSRYYPRRMMAEVMLDAMSQVTGAPTAFADYPSGWRALQLPDSKVASPFLDTFGRPDRLITCDCERNAQPSVVQVLHITNGASLNNKLQAKGNRIEKLLAEATPNDKLVEDVFLAALSRFPSDNEKAKLGAELAASPTADKRQAIEDLFWSVLSSKEFLFNH